MPDDQQDGGLDRRHVLRTGAVLSIAVAAGLPLTACGGGSSQVAADIPAAAPVPVAPARTARPAGTPRSKSQLYRRGGGDVAVTEAVPTRTARPAEPTTQPTTEPSAEPAPPSKGDGLSTVRRGEGSGSEIRRRDTDLIARTDEIPVGGGKVFEQQKIVVTQPTRGEYRAFDATCTHQGCLVSNCRGGTVNCPCHESAFSLEDGSVVNGPAEKPLAEKSIEVAGGEIHHKV